MNVDLVDRKWSAVFAPGLVLLTLVLGCATQPSPQTANPAPQPAALTDSQPTTSKPSQSSKPDAGSIRLLKVEPVKGYSGDTFSVAGEGLPADKEIEFVWMTVDGGFVTKASAETVEFHERKFTEKKISLGRALTDAQGRVNAKFQAPEDYGEVHDIYGTLDGARVAKGGYRIMRQISISPTEGEVGTPITVKITGLGAGIYDSTVAIRYDNKYTGFISAVTTRGSVTAIIRAAGPLGKHVIEVGNANKAVTYLNIQQSPVAHIPQFRFDFDVTQDNGAPTDYLDFPETRRIVTTNDSAAPKTASRLDAPLSAASVKLDPASGSILSPTTLRATGLPKNAEVELQWVSARGNRLSPSGWNLIETPLQKATTNADGALVAKIQVPDDLGGWHVVRIVQGDVGLSETPFYVERSLVSVTPKRVKVGEKFTIQVKGIGWTELDNTVAVTYDNAYIGYACGFNSNGDITLNLIASGTAGTHLIELWPTIYQGNGKPPWNYQLPQLSALEDAPGLALGYNLPVFRLAIEVTE